MVHMVHAYRVSGGRELPLLSDGGDVVAGSSAIVEHLEARYPHAPLIPCDPEEAGLVRLWTQWADRLLAPDARRLLAASWVRRPVTSERFFFTGAPHRERIVFRPLRRPFSLMAAAFRGAYPAAVQASRGRVDAAFKVLDSALAEKQYLVGSSLTLADLSVATAANMALVPVEERERHRARPVVDWVQRTLPEPYQRWQ